MATNTSAIRRITLCSLVRSSVHLRFMIVFRPFFDLAPLLLIATTLVD
jgi:hypothetical protein